VHVEHAAVVHDVGQPLVAAIDATLAGIERDARATGCLAGSGAGRALEVGRCRVAS
jgi:hypothetical protein